MSESASGFAELRVESRFTGTTPLVEPLPAWIRPFHHSGSPSDPPATTNVSTTVVFGRAGASEPVPPYGTLRFRRYSADLFPDDQDTVIIGDDFRGTFMLKCYPDPSSENLVNQKYTLRDVELADIWPLLADHNRLGDLERHGASEEMLELTRRHYGSTAITPLIVVQAARRHLWVDAGELAPARVTLDYQTTFWPIVGTTTDGRLVARKSFTFEPNILEIKRDTVLDPESSACKALFEQLFGSSGHNYEPRGRIKRSLGEKAVDLWKQSQTDRDRGPSSNR